MTTSTYEFSNKEDREMAFSNIVKWFGSTIVKKVEILDLTVEATEEVLQQTNKIVEKHAGQVKLESIA